MIKFKIINTNHKIFKRDNIHIGIIYRNDIEVKKIICSLENQKAIDLFNDSKIYPISDQNLTYVQIQTQIDEILKYLHYPENLNIHDLKKIRKMIYNKNSHIIYNLYQEKHTNKRLNKQLFNTLYYRIFYKNLK